MKRVPIISLYTANAISMVGNVLASIAIPWFVLKTTGSAAQTGLTGFFSIVPVVIAGFLGGALIDRIGYKRTSVIADIASGVTVLLIPLLHFTVGLQLWQLMMLVFLGALLDAPGTTARDALIPDLAEEAGIPLERATAWGQVVERGSRLIGAPLGGILIAFVGTANVLWLDAASFGLSALLVLVAVKGRPRKRESAAGSRYIDEVSQGLKFMGAHQLVLSMVVIVMITNFVDAAFGGVLLPVYVNRIYGSAINLGLFVGVMSGGAVLGALIFGWIGHRWPRFATFVVGFMITSLYVWALAFFLPFPVLLIASAVAGIAAGPLNPIIGTVLFERVPADMRGRVLGAIQAAAWITMPLGVLIAGLLTEWFGLQPLLVAMGLVYLAATGSMLIIPSMRELDQHPNPKQASIAA